MKTILAFLGLFMFASVTSTDLTEKNVANNEPLLLENGDGSAQPRKKPDLAYSSENGDGSAQPRKKPDLA
ncbi:hypothetical protein [Flavobacterium sp.]|uniref:hypothetical protein n=1 Tax=Flavobacterium sp. TaxID=239 RepID=UPI002FD90F9F